MQLINLIKEKYFELTHCFVQKKPCIYILKCFSFLSYSTVDIGVRLFYIN